MYQVTYGPKMRVITGARNEQLTKKSRGNATCSHSSFDMLQQIHWGPEKGGPPQRGIYGERTDPYKELWRQLGWSRY